MTSYTRFFLTLLHRTFCCKLKLYSYYIALFSLAFFYPAFAADSPGIDQLMGGTGPIEHQQRIENLVFDDGKTHNWEEYSRWGKEIFLSGSVKNPPVGPAPSEPVSKLFTCIKCHNYEREDPDPAIQDPEARFEWIEKTGRKVFMPQGTTMWGVVNRETFYPGYFTKYHELCVLKGEKPPLLPCGPVFGICLPGCRTMNPESVEDAVQVCSKYCSVGRHLKRWELYALLAFFWDQEIKLEDLSLSPQQVLEAETVLTSTGANPQKAKEMRTLLASRYSTIASNTFRGMPQNIATNSDGTIVVEYIDGTKVTGDPARGKKLWSLTCGRCHESKKKPLTAKKADELTEDLDEFHEMLAEGTRSSRKRYMPNYTRERLSRQQAADILIFLKNFSEK